MFLGVEELPHTEQKHRMVNTYIFSVLPFAHETDFVIK